MVLEPVGRPSVARILSKSDPTPALASPLTAPPATPPAQPEVEPMDPDLTPKAASNETPQPVSAKKKKNLLKKVIIDQSIELEDGPGARIGHGSFGSSARDVSEITAQVPCTTITDDLPFLLISFCLE